MDKGQIVLFQTPGSEAEIGGGLQRGLGGLWWGCFGARVQAYCEGGARAED